MDLREPAHPGQQRPQQQQIAATSSEHASTEKISAPEPTRNVPSSDHHAAESESSTRSSGKLHVELPDSSKPGAAEVTSPPVATKTVASKEKPPHPYLKEASPGVREGAKQQLHPQQQLQQQGSFTEPEQHDASNLGNSLI